MVILSKLDIKLKEPKSRKGYKALKDKMPKNKENERSALFLKASKMSPTLKDALKEFMTLKFPFAKERIAGQVKNPLASIDDVVSKCSKNDCSLFAFGRSAIKKKRDFLTLGRSYNDKIFDTVEFLVKNFKSMKEFKDSDFEMRTVPTLVFNGSLFESDDVLRNTKELLITFFNSRPHEKLNPKALSLILSFTATSDKNVLLRTYRYVQKSSEEFIIDETGPSMDLEITQHTEADRELRREAIKKPQDLVSKAKNNRNSERDDLGNKYGKLRIAPQDLNRLNRSTFKKALRK